MLELTPVALRAVADFVEGLNALTERTGVELDASFGGLEFAGGRVGDLRSTNGAYLACFDH